MKTIFIWLLSFQVFFSLGCSHNVYKLDISSENLETISSDVVGRCEDNCEVDHCWMETENLTMCSVKFSVITDSLQKRILTTSAGSLKDKGLTVGFCGYESVTDPAAGSFFKGMGGGGVASSSTGGSPFTSVSGTHANLTNQIAPPSNTVDNQTIQKACQTQPSLK